jgi:hypothetical protein
MTVSLAMFLILSGVMLGALAAYQRSYGGVQLLSGLDQSVRSALELVAQEVGQAGSVGTLSDSALTAGTIRTLSSAVTASATAQTVNVSSASGFYVNEKVLVDIGTAQEQVQLTAVASASITGIFTQAHASGAPIVVVGMFPDGILPPSGVTATTATTVQATTLNFYGDIHGDGTTVEVKYTCDTTNRLLTRQEVPYPNPSGAAVVTSTILPNVSSCLFTYATPVTYTISSVSYTFYPSVSLALTVQSATPNPQTGTVVSLTRQMGDIQPRNIVMGMAAASGGTDTKLQLDPTGNPGVPLL